MGSALGLLEMTQLQSSSACSAASSVCLWSLLVHNDKYLDHWFSSSITEAGLSLESLIVEYFKSLQGMEMKEKFILVQRGLESMLIKHLQKAQERCELLK